MEARGGPPTSGVWFCAMAARMTSMGMLCFVGLVACDPKPEPTRPGAKTGPPDKTEVTMEVTPVASAAEATATEEPPKPAPSDDTIGGKQPPEIEKAVAPVRPRIRACYNKSAASEPAAGSASFDVVIGKDGKVTTARILKHEGISEDFMNCLVATVRTMTFEGDKKSQFVTFTFGGVK
jgi:outer membrane biosynthesis protein TonB